MPRFPSPQQMLALGSIPASYNGHAADAAAGDTTIVLGQTDRGVLQLSRPCLPPKLEVRLKDHPQPAGSDRVTEALQAAISVDRYFTSQVEGASLDSLLVFAPGAETKVFTVQQLSDGKAVMQFGNVYLLSRVLDPCLIIGHLTSPYNLISVEVIVIRCYYPLCSCSRGYA